MAANGRLRLGGGLLARTYVGASTIGSYLCRAPGQINCMDARHHYVASLDIRVLSTYMWYVTF